jgi:AraC family transcriptional regulator, positive regulator of tynA and feaB
MPHLETISTMTLPPHQRVDFWNDLLGNAFTPLVTSPVDRHTFAGTLTSTRLDDIRLAEARSEPARVRHSRQHVASAREALFLFCLQLSGRSVARQQGRETLLHYGDFCMVDSLRPYEVSFNEYNEMLVLSIPQPELARRMTNPESVLGAPMSGQSGLAGLVSSLLGTFWQQRLGGDDYFVSPRFGVALLDLIASAYASLPAAGVAGSSVAVARREQVRGYIESNLHDPSLTPARIAQSVHLSPRRLHQLFEEDGETVGGYLLRRRLEECALAIADPAQRGRTVTEIAFMHGFNNASHFGRAFRERYGHTPGDHRRLAITAEITRA